MGKLIYMDNAATTFVDKRVLDAMTPYLTDRCFNPSSIYDGAQDVHADLDNARATIAKTLNASDREIYFTACGTESDNWAIKGVAHANADKGKHLITSKIEHHAVLHSMAALEKEGYDVTYLDVDENGVFSYSDPFCKHCHSHKVTKHGYNTRDLINENGEHVIVKVQRYYCPVCGKYSQTEFNGEYENYCNFSNETKERSIKVHEISWYPFRKLKELYQFFCGIEISHETVRKAQIVTNSLYYLNKEIQPSGFYGYDVQWEPLDDGFHYRHLLFDLVNNAPVAELLAPDEELKTTYDFINKSLKPIDRKAIVTDLKPGYDSVMQKLGFKHQHGTYHLRLAVNERIRKHLKEKDLEFRVNELKENETISKSKLDEKVETKIEELKSEINIYKQLIFELFNQ